VCGADELTTFLCRISFKSEKLNVLEPSGPHRDCYGTRLSFYNVYTNTNTYNIKDRKYTYTM